MFLGSIPQGYEVDHLDGNSLNNCVTNLRCCLPVKNKRNKGMYHHNTSGVTGVHLNVQQAGYSYWLADFYDIGGKKMAKSFSILKLGNDEAFRLACEYREKMVKELNEKGAGYTERHGQ